MRLASDAGLFEALQFAESSKQRPGAAFAQPEMADAAASAGLEAEEEPMPCGRRPGELPRGGRGGSERALEPCADRGAAFGRLDVPGESDEVAPVAVGPEEL